MFVRLYHPGSFLFSLFLFICYFSSFLFIFHLPRIPFPAQRLYIDENSWNVNSAITPIQEEKEFKKLEKLYQESRSQNQKEFFFSSLSAHNIETNNYTYYPPNSSLTHPLLFNEISIEILYAIVRARGGDGKEAVLLVVEYEEREISSLRSGRKSQQQEVASPLVLAIRFANYLSTVRWLARDFIVVAVERKNWHRDLGLNDSFSSFSSSSSALHSHAAFSSWLSTYLGENAHSINLSYKERFHRAGNILLAVCIDFPLNNLPYQSIALTSTGDYGLAANLDLISVWTKILSKSNITPLLSPIPHSKRSILQTKQNSQLPYPFILTKEQQSLYRYMIDQALQEYRYYHSILLGYSIDALTIRGLQNSPLPSSSSSSFSSSSSPLKSQSYRLLICLESFYHSANNLIERLHHNTWLYLIIDDIHFVSMGKYIYAYALIMAPVPLVGIYDLYRHEEKEYIHSILLLLLIHFLSLLPIAFIWLLAKLSLLNGVSVIISIFLCLILMILCIRWFTQEGWSDYLWDGNGDRREVSFTVIKNSASKNENSDSPPEREEKISIEGEKDTANGNELIATLSALPSTAAPVKKSAVSSFLSSKSGDEVYLSTSFDYVTFHSFLSFSHFLLLSPLAVVNFSLTLLISSIITLLTLLSPPIIYTQKKSYWHYCVILPSYATLLMILVLTSPPMLMLFYSYYKLPRKEFYSVQLINFWLEWFTSFIYNFQIYPLQYLTIFLLYLPRYLTSLLLFTLKWELSIRKTLQENADDKLKKE